MRVSAFILLLTILNLNAYAQFELKTQIDIGENNVSEGNFGRFAVLGGYHIDKYRVELGPQFKIQGIDPNILDGTHLTLRREMTTKKHVFYLKTHFIVNRFSDVMNKINWGFAYYSEKHPKFIYSLGYNFKSYRVNAKGKDQFNLTNTSTSISENFNFIYNFSYLIKPNPSTWNLAFSITNIDFFEISQSTNPILNMKFKYESKSDISFFTEFWYKQAGVMNINANYFGYFIRGGVLWEFQKSNQE